VILRFVGSFRKRLDDITRMHQPVMGLESAGKQDPARTAPATCGGRTMKSSSSLRWRRSRPWLTWRRFWPRQAWMESSSVPWIWPHPWATCDFKLRSESTNFKIEKPGKYRAFEVSPRIGGRTTVFSSTGGYLLPVFLDGSSAKSSRQIYNPSAGPERMARRSGRFPSAA
jgi:hypothetical protein